jgi:type IV pilus assembly protein PilV
MNHCITTRKTQSGVMLLEALIGILIFSLGVLALVGMQALAIKVATESRERAEASNLASQLIGEMWINRGNLSDYNYSAGSGSVPSVLTGWVSQVQAALPNADTLLPSVQVGTPGLAGVGGSEIIITIRWQAPGATSARQFLTTAYMNDITP